MPGTIPCLDLHFPSVADHPDLPDMVSLALDDLAPAAIHEVGDDFAPTWRIFLSEPTRIDHAARQLAARFGATGLRIELVEVDDQDWAARSQAHLTRVTVGTITVAPPWDATPPADGVLVIVYPSTGFGTGHHQTTRLCLRLLQKVELAGRRAVDLGTGSGVLALAAWRLGASDIEALDDDEDAVVNARENLRLNGAESAITLRHADLRVDPVAPGDVVTANLTGALLISQAPSLIALVQPGGTLIVSGFLESEVDAIRAMYTPALTQVEDAGEDAWRALLFKRSADPTGLDRGVTASARAGGGVAVVGGERAAVEQARFGKAGRSRHPQIAGLADDLVAHQIAGVPRLFGIETVGPGPHARAPVELAQVVRRLHLGVVGDFHHVLQFVAQQGDQGVVGVFGVELNAHEAVARGARDKAHRRAHAVAQVVPRLDVDDDVGILDAPDQLPEGGRAVHAGGQQRCHATVHRAHARLGVGGVRPIGMDVGRQAQRDDKRQRRSHVRPPLREAAPIATICRP